MYFLNGIEIHKSTLHKDLGTCILFDDNLKFHNHTSAVAGKSNRMLGLISKSFEFLEPVMVSKLYKALVRLILEYSNPVLGPSYFYIRSKED